MLQVTDQISIPDTELEERFVRASGPGGQNVNKVATAVELRFDAGGSSVLTDEVRTRLMVIAGHRMTSDGFLVIDARRYRTQAQNRDDARMRLVELVRQALIRPKRRRRTRPSRASVQQRIEGKKRRSETKRSRRPVAGEG